MPVDDLYALPVMCEAIAAKALPDLVVVSPDAGFVKKARQWSDRLNVPLAIADKRRTDHSESAEVLELMGSVEGRTALIVDDFTISGGYPRRRGPPPDRTGSGLGICGGHPWAADRDGYRAGSTTPRSSGCS